MSSPVPLGGPMSATLRRRVAFSCLIFFGLVPLLAWPVVFGLLQADVGLDLTDEGLYLIAADPPGPLASWGFPFGWHTRPLFALANYDIATFRTLGGVLLVAVMSWLGFLLAILIQARSSQSKRARLWAYGCLPSVGACGALLYYVSMLRTPSYNWLVLMGIAGTSCGALLWCLRSSSKETDAANPVQRRVLALLVALLSSASLFVTIPAKPSVLPMMLILTSVLILCMKGRRSALYWLVLVIALLPLWLMVAVVTRVWPFEFVRVFRLALNMPMPSPAQTPQRAFLNAVLLPREVVAQFGQMGDATALALLLSLTLLLVPLLLRRRLPFLSFVGLCIASAVGAAVAGVPLPVLNPSGRPYGLAAPTLTSALLIMCAAGVLTSIGLASDRRSGQGPDRTMRMILALCLFLGVLPFVFSFGSDNGIYGQASIAGGFFLLASQVFILGRMESTGSLALSMLSLVITIGFVAVGLVGGWRYPHRMDAFTLQTTRTEIGSHGAVLRLSPQLAATLTSLRSQAQDSGWISRQTPLLDISYTWNPGIPYALGAQVPQSLQLTIFGYATSHDIASYHLTPEFQDFPFSSSWLLITDPGLLDEDEARAVDFTINKVSEVSGRAFPSSFDCFYAGEFQIWYPRRDNSELTPLC